MGAGGGGPNPPVLVGRQDEQRAVEELVRRLPGTGGALAVRGEPGLGKSTLLEEATGLAVTRGFQILRTAGVEPATHIAFAGLQELLRPARALIARLARPQRAALSAAFGQSDETVPDVFLIALATLDLVAETAARAPVLLVVEDAQWLDPATAEVVAFLASRLEFEPAALLAAIRPGYPGPLTAAAVATLDLSPLPDAAAGALLDARFPHLAGPVRRRVLAEAAGNPLALVELPVQLPAGLDDGAVTALPWLPLSERLQQAFGARTAGLPPATATLLLVAAVDDGDLISEILAAARASGGPDEPGGVHAPDVDDLAPAEAAGLVHLDAQRLRFRHPLVRSAILQRSTPGQRQRAHAALARLLDGQIERRAWHRGASVVGPDDGIAAELDAAGTRAQRRGGVGTAVAAFERAAQLSTDPGAQADRLLRAATLAAEIGRPEAVARLLAQARTLPLSPARQALYDWIRDTFDDGIRDVVAGTRSLADLATRISADGDDDLAMRVLWGAAIRCYFGEPGDDVRARLAATARRAATGPADPRLLAILGHVAPVEQGRAILQELPEAMARAAGDPTVTRLLGNAALAAGALDVGLALCTAASAGLRAQGRLALLARATSTQAWSALLLMDLGVAVPTAREAIRLSRETSQPNIALLARSREALIAAMRGEPDAVERIATEVEREGLPLGIRPALAAVQVARGLSALGAGRYADAFEHLRRVHDPADPAYHLGMRCFFVADAVEAGLRSGRREQAQQLMAGMEAAGRRTPSPALHVNLRHARALLAHDGEAEELFGAALRADLVRWPFARARAQLAYGEWLRRRRRSAEARGHLRAAREAFDALGVVPWGERARAELRASGEPSRGRVVQARELLTPQELQIAQMAAQGLTNREIGQKLYLSHRTVSTHLHRIFPKLGVTSRGALKAALSPAGAGAGEEAEAETVR